MTRQEILGLIVEIEAYRSLEGLPFDFGGGLIENELSFGTEEAYWKMGLQELYGLLDSGWINYEAEYYDEIPPTFPVSYRLNRYERRKETQRRMKKIHSQEGSYFHSLIIVYNDGFYRRFYLSGRRNCIKHCSNKAVRKHNSFCLRGSGYRKVFDYWWELT